MTSRRVWIWWSVTWRVTVNTLLGMLFFLAVYGPLTDIVSPWSAEAGALLQRMLIDAVLGVAMIVTYAFRHRAPRAIPLVVIALSMFSVSGAPAAMSSVATVAARRRWREIAIAAPLFMVASLVEVTAYPLGRSEPWWQDFLAVGVAASLLVILGLLVGTRRQLGRSRDEQLAAALTLQQAQLDRARSQERTRIAREMHDALGHRLSLVIMHAGALEYRSDLSAEQTASAAGVIREHSRIALQELRQILGVLRDDEHPDGPPSASENRPQPSTENLQELIAEVRAAGTTVRAECEGPLTEIPPTTGRHTYRIVQECLTNARKHAGHAAIDLRVHAHRETGIHIRVHNASSVPPRPPGLGLTGIQERARLIGGSVRVTPLPGQFTVEAYLPWPT